MIYIILSIVGIMATLLVNSEWSTKGQAIFILTSIIIGQSLFFGIYFFLENQGLLVIEKGDPSFERQISWFEISLYFTMISWYGG